MLSETALLQQCESYGVLGVSGGELPKPKLIAALSKQLRMLDKGRMLTDGSAAAAAAAAAEQIDTASIEDVEHDELPTNLWWVALPFDCRARTHTSMHAHSKTCPAGCRAMESDQLAAVCAAYDLEYDEKDGKATLIKIIEGAR